MVIAGSTWSTSSVNALLAGLIGIAATLLGSLTTYLFQSRTAERAQSFERDERLRYGVHFFEGWVIAGCFGHAVSPRAGMLSGS